MVLLTSLLYQVFARSIIYPKFETLDLFLVQSNTISAAVDIL